VYLTSFVHREGLFDIAQRWFCGRPHGDDAKLLTEILICDGFVIGETLEVLARKLLDYAYGKPVRPQPIRRKGELRDALTLCTRERSPRVEELFRLYRRNPDFYYREAPINGVMCLDDENQIVCLYRIKRPKRIAEKANRKIAHWIFKNVQDRARRMAEERARGFGVPVQQLITPRDQMDREFIVAEEGIARSFREGAIQFERDAIAIHDVGALKIVADERRLDHLETMLATDPEVRIVERESYWGPYQATNLILEVAWDADHVSRRYAAARGWERYLNRGLPKEKLEEGLPLITPGVEPTIKVELILSTFPDMVESELGDSIHEERILAQRDNKIYKGYIPTNVEFLLEYLFAVGFSPRADIEEVPIKLWGRYLPETLSSYVRQLYDLPEYDIL
jgi:hypothetical protein